MAAVVRARMSDVLEQALTLHRAGRLDAAERLYNEVLQAQPDTADAWHFLGLIALSRRDIAGAVERIRRAIAFAPHAGVYHFNLGVALSAQGDLAAAIASYRQAVELSPGLAEANNNLGNCLRETGDREGAAVAFRRAIVHRPTYFEAHVNLSKALLDLGRLEGAETTARRALNLEGHHPLAQFQLANVLQVRGRYAEAAEIYRSVLRDDPSIHGVRVNLGNALTALGDYAGAGRLYEEELTANPGDLQAHFGFIRTRLHLGRYDEAITAIARAPEGGPGEARDFAEIFVRIGIDFQQRGDSDAAARWFRQAVARAPEFALAHFNLGLASQHQGRLNEATACYAAALEIDPGYVDARKNLAILYLMLGRAGAAIATYREGLAARPDVPDFHRLMVAATLYDPSWTNEARYSEARRFAALYAPAPGQRPAHHNSPDPERRLRIGYLSSDFRDHPVGRNIEPLLLHRHRNHFEVFAYAELARPDETTARLRTLTDVWRSTTGRSDEEVAAQMRADRLDILVSLASHLDENRPLVSAFHPAPIQISFHDVTTSGLDGMDYLLADRVVCPVSGNEQFTERVIRLPSVYVHEAIADAPAVGPLPCRSTGRVSFGCLNNPAKVNGAILGLWGQILRAVPDSRLVLKFRRWYETSEIQGRVLMALAALGVERERIEFLGGDDHLARHLEIYSRIDVALDTFPFAGSTTTFEALSMGVPVVTLMGGNMMSRWSASILKVLALDDLVTDTPQDYVAVATALAADPERLAALRSSLRERLLRSPLVNGPLRTRQVERVYRAVWRRWCASRRDRGVAGE